ncbi:hypothetical protein J4Q44_G00082880 [Coregonus suidteri]|uniref:Uncharacterized protein n=1 Tax=Coregonus suidteri TaxID=861788 RepID=A0AAN8M8D1_9TELE
MTTISLKTQRVFDRNITSSVQQDETLEDLQKLASKLPWTNALKARAWGRGEAGSPDLENSPQSAQQTVEGQEPEGQEPRAKVLKLCVTCSRAGDKHSFSPNETTRDFGGAVQDFFQWKADMIKFDIEGPAEHQ